MTTPDNSLTHFGIKGMRWGFRKDRRTGKHKPTAKVLSADHQKKVSMKKKSLSEMSNAELKELNQRLQLERQYKDLTKRQISSGEKFAKDVIQEVGKDLVKNALKTGVKAAGELALSFTKANVSFPDKLTK